MSDEHPLRIFERWLADARERGVSDPMHTTLSTVGADGAPSARTVSLKRVEADALIITSTLWSRKAREIAGNPRVSLLFHWPQAERQVHVAGEARQAERPLAEELFGERDLAHRVQTLVSRQGDPVADLDDLRKRHAHLMATLEAPPACPDDWGAFRIAPHAIELFSESPDRIHERVLFLRAGDGWTRTLLSP